MQAAEQNGVHVIARPSPFSGRQVRSIVPAGRTVAELVDAHLKDVGALVGAHVWIGPDYVPRDMWHCVRLKEGSVLNIRAVPMGGGGKNPLAAILSIAVMAIAPGIGVALSSSLGLAGAGLWAGSTFFSASTLIGGAVSVIGKLAINALLPPPKQRSSASGGQDSTTLFISGAQNQLLPFGRVPRVLGKMRHVPPLGARPYTETVGDAQYLRMLFCLGYGPLEVSDLKIGETPLSEFDDVEIEIRHGYEDDEPITLFSNSVFQTDLSILLEEANGFEVRRTEPDADEISIDVTFEGGLVRFSGSGAKREETVQLEVQYSLADANDWSAGITTYKAISAQTSPKMERPKEGSGTFSRRLRVYRVVMDPASGALSVIAGSITVVGQQDEVIPAVPSGKLPIAQVWRYSDDPVDVPSGRITDERGSALTDGTFEASGDFLPGTTTTDDCISVAAGGLKFNGIEVTAKQTSAIRRSVRFAVPRGQYDVRIRRITEDTDDQKIIDKVKWTALRTIRSVVPIQKAGIAQIAMRIKATDQLNGVVDRFNCVVHSIVPDWDAATETWIERVTSNPASLFRTVLQDAANKKPQPDSRLDLAGLQAWHEACAAAGYEFNTVQSGDDSVEEVLGNIASAGRATPARPEGKWTVVRDKVQTVPVQHFTPRNTFGFRGEISYPEVPHAFRVRFNNRDKGWEGDERIVYQDGYTAANATEFVVLDLPGCTSADLAWKAGRYYMATLLLRPENYIFSADIEHIVCTRGDLVRFTHDVVLAGLGYGRIKQVGTSGGNVVNVTIDDDLTMVSGKSYAVRIRMANGASLYKTIQTTVGTGRVLTFSTPFPISEGPAAGDLLMFGEAGKESIELIVKEIRPNSDKTATLTCVDYAPGVLAAETGTIPPFNSQVTVPPELQRPPQPQLVSFQSDEDVLIRNPDGTFTATAVLTLAPAGWPIPLTPVLKVKGVEETDFYDAQYTVNGNRLTIFGLETGEYYDLRVFYRNPQGVSSVPLSLFNQLVTGDENPPADVTGFTINILNGTAFLSWNEVPDVDLDFYRIKFNAAVSGATWENSIDLFERVSGGQTSIGVPAQAGTYLIKAYDYGGRESIAAAEIVSNIGEILGFNAVEEVTESPTFAGVKEDVVVVTDTLQLTMGVTEGVYYFDNDIDLGSVYTSLVTATIGVTGVTRDDNVDLWTNVDAIPNWDGSADTSKWQIEVQIRTTNDDPSGTPTWTAWQKLIVSEYTARAYQFRVLLLADDTNTTPSISDLSITVDMPDRVDGARGVDSEASDTPSTRVDFSAPFRAVPALAIITYNMATGDYYEILANDEAGFNIAFFNASGTRVNRTFDWIAKGYGYEL